MKKLYFRLTKSIEAHPKFDFGVVFVALTLFGFLTLRTIGASSIWFDEAFSAYLTRFDFIEIARYTATDVHPPLFYWLLKLWSELFGTSELAFRSMSVMFGMIVLATGFLLVRRLFGRRAAWLSILLLAISPMFIRYSQEARMYTMAAAIVLGATHVLITAIKSDRRRTWVLYGLLVSLGMWTHYFTALVWLSHWLWRLLVIRQSKGKSNDLLKNFFSKNWIIAHIVAVGLFLPWIPYMAMQLGLIQGTGFWIGPISTDTLTNYLTNVVFYLEHDEVLGWWVMAFVAIIASLAVLAARLYQSMDKESRQNYLLIIILAFAPVVLLFLASMPPLKSSFVERYLIPSAVGFSLFAGITVALAAMRTSWRNLLIGLIAICFMFGVSNVYYYGNYNKNSKTQINTRQIIEEITDRGMTGAPIIASSPWVFYEAVFYSTPEHPVYFIDANTEYIYGSLDMLKYSDDYKIKDLYKFAEQHPVVWYMGNSGSSELVAPSDSWTELQKFSIHSGIEKSDSYKAVQFRTN